MKTALVVGGTGPTGPYVLTGLMERSYEVTIFHRGTHEPEGLPDVRHIHGDPHFADSIDECVGDGDYDLVLAAYGRTKLLARSFQGRTDRFLAVGGPPRYQGFYRTRSLDSTSDPTIPIREDHPLVGASEPEQLSSVAFSRRMVETEEAVFASHPGATYLIYPVVYGPRNIIPWEWSVIKRALDGREQMLIPDDGLTLHSKGAAVNMAHALLTAVDQPDKAMGQVFNCADDEQLSLRQYVEALLASFDNEVELVGIPASIAPLYEAIYVPSARSIAAHTVLDTGKIRSELGYRDVVSPRAALAQSVEYYLANPVSSENPPPAFVDTFDYELEDRMILAWKAFSDSFRAEFVQSLPDEIHPMPHPKKPGLLLDERAR